VSLSYSRLIWLFLALALGCRSQEVRTTSSYEKKVGEAERALQKGKIFEARRLTIEALEMKPESQDAEKLMAQTIDREMARQKLPAASPEEIPPQERKLHAKTLLERSRTFLRMEEFGEAQLAAEEVFRYDPDNSQASELMDEIREKTKKAGQDENIFLEKLYEEEIDSRIGRYMEQAKLAIEQERWGAAHMALEKILLLSPRHKEGERLLALLEKKEKK